MVYLNIPNGTFARTGQAYDPLPSYLYSIPKLTILRTPIDYGPVMKLTPSLQVEKDPSTIIITVDDDKLYDSEMVKTLVWHAEHDPFTAFGYCGWAFMWVFEPHKVVPAYAPISAMRGSDGLYTDVLQAVCGNAYRRSFFPQDEQKLALLNQPPPPCFTTDDIWIAGTLAASGIRRVLVPVVIMPTMKTKTLKDNRATALSTINAANMNDIKCIRAVEKRYEMEWPTARSFKFTD